jgi:hypothetical protein
MSSLDAIREYLTELDWDFQVDEDAHAAELEYAGSWGVWDVVLLDRVDHRQTVVYSFVPVEVREDQLALAFELVSRINYGLTLVTFEVSPESGLLRCRTGVAWGKGPPSKDQIGTALQLNLYAVDRYLRAFHLALTEGMEPVAAVSFIDNGGD